MAKLKKNCQQKLTDDRKSADKLIEVKIYKTNHHKIIKLLKHKDKSPNELVNDYIKQEYDRIFSGDLRVSESLKAISNENKQKDKVDKQKIANEQSLPKLSTITTDSKQKAIATDQNQINHTLNNQEQTSNHTGRQVTHTKELNKKFESHDYYQDDFQFERQLSNSRRGWSR